MNKAFDLRLGKVNATVDLCRPNMFILFFISFHIFSPSRAKEVETKKNDADSSP